MALAFNMYATDSADAIIPYISYNNLSMYNGGFWPSYPALSPSTPISTCQQYAANALQQGPLWQYAPSAKVYHCVGDLRWRNLKPGSGWAWGSYSKMDGMNGGGWGMTPYKKMSQILRSSDAGVFLEESDPRTENNGTWVLNPAPSPGWVDCFAILHGNLTGFGFADGHVETHKWLDPAIIKAATDMANGVGDFYWPGGGPGNPDFVWVYNHYFFVEWRGL